MTAAGVAANLGGIALVMLPGLGVTELLVPLRRLPWLRRLGYAYLTGVGALGGTLFAVSHLGGVPLRRPAIIVAALAPAALGLAAALARRRLAVGNPDAVAPRTRPAAENAAAVVVAAVVAAPENRTAAGVVPAAPGIGRRLRVVAALATAVVLAGPLISALTGPLADWDGRMTWSPLAAYLRHEGTVDAEVLRDAHWLVLHPRYPPLLPLAQAAVQEALGAGQDEQFFRALYVAFLGALLVMVYDGARRAAGRWPAKLTTLCACLPPFFSYGGGGATSAYNDLPLAALYGGAVVLLLAYRPRPLTGLAAGCLLAAVLLTKNEGVLLAAAAILLAASRLWRRRRGSRRPAATGRHLAWLAATALPVLAAAALLAAWRAAIPNRGDDDYFASLGLGELLHGAVSRLPLISRAVLRLSFSPAAWLGFWAVFLVVVLAGRQALARPVVRRMLIAGLVPLIIGCAAYTVSSRPAELIDETWPRFLVQAFVPLAVVFASALAPMLRQVVARRRPSAPWAPSP